MKPVGLTRALMRGRIAAILVSLIFISCPWTGVESLSDETERYEVEIVEDNFNQTGYIRNDIHHSPDGEAHVSRPDIYWVTAAQGMISIRTGACSVAIEQLGEVWMMGGRTDPNPTQSGDEIASNQIETMEIENKTWWPAQVNLPHAQQYCEAEMVGDLVIVVGEWNRNSNPYVPPSGRVQIYNISNETWYSGRSMPSSHERGNGGMAEEGGMLYYAGGFRNAAGTDATNRTYRYDPATDLWTRMADMNQPRASFELVNFQGLLYAIGGTQSTSTWNRQALNYVEVYDPSTDTWTNLSSLPQAMFGWGATVHHNEIVLVGGFNGGAKKSVYHWNPVEDTWNQGRDINSIGHFDVEVQSLNGSIVWGTGDMSSYPYSTWSQMFSADTEFMNSSDHFSGWITSPVIDMRPSFHSHTTPVWLDLQGTERPGGKLAFQYRTSSDSVLLLQEEWIGQDGTVNTTFPSGMLNIYPETHSEFIQYRIEMNVTDLENWDEPDLDQMIIRAEHAAFMTQLQSSVHPRGETLHFQTSHDGIDSTKSMELHFASCDFSGAINGPWSTLSHDGTTFQEFDTQGLFIDSNGVIVTNEVGKIEINWTIDLGDLIGITHLCTKVVTDSEELTEYQHTTVMAIDRSLEVAITDLGDLEIGQPVPGNFDVDIGIQHVFPTSGATLSSGVVQARLIFRVQGNEPGIDSEINWSNITTPWTDLTTGQTDVFTWTTPTNLSGLVDIDIEARSDQPFTITTTDNSSVLLLDNDAPVIMSSDPVNGSYINSEEDREISLLIADTSGFVDGDVHVEIWVEGLDDGSDGSMPDSMPQSNEYRVVNHTMEPDVDGIWWFNLTQSDDANDDHSFVHLRLVGNDAVGTQFVGGHLVWETRDAQNAVIESLSNSDVVQMWEIERELSYMIEISDANTISDVISIRIELGGDDDFGMTYDVADQTCSVLDTRLNSDRLMCSHAIENGNMLVNVSMVASWEVDRSSIDQGLMEIRIQDLDGFSRTTYSDLWLLSEEFDFSIDKIEDISGPTTGEITNQSFVMSGDELRLTGSMQYALSGAEFQGDLSIQWWGTLQGQNWFGAGTISVVDGEIDTIIPMPTTGGILEMNVNIMDPFENIILGTYELPVFIVDSAAPVALDSSVETLSRYHLDNIEIGVNVIEEDSWSGNLDMSCQVKSTEFSWPVITNSKEKSTIFQGRSLFAFAFDFSEQGDPSTLSPEARIDCWLDGLDDAGWELIASNNNTVDEPWLSLPLNDIGPNIQLVEVKIDGELNPGSELRLEVVVKNTGEDLQDSFNITVHVVQGDERELIWRYNQGQIKSGQGIVKRVAITIPDGDWSMEVSVDADQDIWELNEDDNTFVKDFEAVEETSFGLYAGIGIGIVVLLALIVIMKRRGENELTAAKQAPKIEDLPKSGPPVDMRKRESKPGPDSKPKKGPPPKRKPANVPVDAPVADVSDAMAKLSLDSLPGVSEQKSETVPSYEQLPPGGDYEYTSEGTLYTGEGIGTWELQEDGSFIKKE